VGLERGHRTLTITRKGGTAVTIPLAPRTARAIDLATDERTDGPIFLTADGRRLDGHGAGRIVRRVAHRAGITKKVSPHTLRHAFITAALDAGVPLRDGQEAASHPDPRTTMRYDRARGSLEARHLHCRRLRRRRRPVTRTGGQQLRLAVTAARRTGPWSPDDHRCEKVTGRDLNTNGNRRYPRRRMGRLVMCGGHISGCSGLRDGPWTYGRFARCLVRIAWMGTALIAAGVTAER
jgi:hypothetical protein